MLKFHNENLFKLREIMDKTDLMEVIRISKEIEEDLDSMMDYVMSVKVEIQKKIDALIHTKFFDISTESNKVEEQLKKVLKIREIYRCDSGGTKYSTVYCVALHPHLPVALSITNVSEQRSWTFNDPVYKGEFSDSIKMPIFGWGNSIVEAAYDYRQALKNYKTR